MGWFNDIFKKSEKRSSLENPSTTLVEWLNGGVSNKSGQLVSSETALGVSAAWRAISLIAGSVASLPIHVYEVTQNGRKALPNHPISKLLNNPNPQFYTGFTFRERMIQNLAGSGNGIAVIKYSNTGLIESLELPLRPVRVKIIDGYLVYLVEGLDKYLFFDDVIHFVGFGDDPFWGKSPVQVHAENLGISLASQSFAATYFGNGGTIAGVLKTDKLLTPQQKMDLAADWKRKYGGGNTNSTAILDLGFEYKPIGSKPQESQLLEARKFQVEEIARIFGVPLHLLYSLDRATFNNIEVMNATYVQHTLTNYIERVESELNRKLLRNADNLEIRFNMDALMRGDMNARSDYYNRLFQIAAISPNEIRKLEGLSMYDGGGVYYRPLNMDIVGTIKEENNV
jgi:HK97 family phage portal protein